MYRERYGLDPARRLPQDRDWTPAEVKACCRLAALLDVPLIDAAQNIVPVADHGRRVGRAAAELGRGRCLSADRPGIYSRSGSGTERPGRSVQRSDPSAN